ncbi:hypothetical protein SAMN05216327_101292 [Dyadobacter sp. SG02]|nr:hypothetical protein SAMN05216327_101292 [Dyadobacter sp. SG02]
MGLRIEAVNKNQFNSEINKLLVQSLCILHRRYDQFIWKPNVSKFSALFSCNMCTRFYLLSSKAGLARFSFTE